MLLQAAAALAPMQSLMPAALAYSGMRLASSATGGAVKVGFVGLGAIGLRMARNLLGEGKHLVVYDSNEHAVERFLSEAHSSQGPGWGSVQAARSPAEVTATRGVSVVFTVLPGAEAVRKAYLGHAGLLSPGAGIVPRVLVDCTTLDPPTARELEGRVRGTRINAALAAPPLPGLAPDNPTLLDAPVSGGIIGAEKGTLSFLVGGDEAALPSVEPLLRAMGTSVTWCGDPGDAQAARLCNTLVQAATMAATSEALALARRLGVEPEVMTRVLNSGSGRSWVSERYNPVPGLTPDAPASQVGQGYRGGLRTNQVLEHLRMALSAAERCHSPVPIGKQLQEIYSKVVDEGMGDHDFAAIYRYVYGGGSSTAEWRSGETLFNSHH